MPTWRERIVAARGRGHFTEEEQMRVASWTTCAVGEAHKAHPLVVRYSDCSAEAHMRYGIACGCPRDSQLEQLGDYHVGGFMWAVKYQKIDAAESLLDQIEDRVLELKRGSIHG